MLGGGSLTSPAQAESQGTRCVTPKHPEHSDNQPENQGQPRAITAKALGFLLPPQSAWDSHLLYIRVGISIWENIRVFLAEDMAHSAARDNLEAATTHPHSEGDFCKTGVPPHHGSVPPRGKGTQDGSIGAPGPRKWSALPPPSVSSLGLGG